MVDLAGSERLDKSGAVGERMHEATRINLSLTALGNVISALSTHANHVPFRDSKLTKLLMDSLGGTSRTVIIATVSPAANNLTETLSTLRYASHAKTIKNKPVVNISTQGSMLKDFQDEIAKLRTQAGGTAADTIDSTQRQINVERLKLAQSLTMAQDERSRVEKQLN